MKDAVLVVVGAVIGWAVCKRFGMMDSTASDPKTAERAEQGLLERLEGAVDRFTDSARAAVRNASSGPMGLPGLRTRTSQKGCCT